MRTVGMRRRHVVAIVGIGVALAGAGCAGSSGGDTSTSGASDSSPLTIGVLNAQTGALGIIGEQEQAGIDLAVAQINAKGGVKGRQLKTKLVDEKGSVNEATAGFKRLALQDKVPAIIGPGVTADAQATAPLAKSYKTLQLSLVAQPEIAQGNPYSFQVAAPQEANAQAIVEWAAKNVSGKTAALITANNPYGDLGAKYIKQFAAKNAIKIVSTNTYNQDAFDFSPQAGKIARSKAAMVLMFGAGGNSDGLVLKAIRAGGYKGQVVGDLTLSTSQIPSVAGQTASEQLVSLTEVDFANPSGQTKTFIDDYAAKNGGKTPSVLTALGYDALYMVAEAIKGAKSSSNDDIAAAMAALDYTGVIGQHRFDGDDHGGPDATAFKPIGFKDGKYVAPTGATR